MRRDIIWAAITGDEFGRCTFKLFVQLVWRGILLLAMVKGLEIELNRIASRFGSRHLKRNFERKRCNFIPARRIGIRASNG
jgi:hypothetical protein